MLLLEKVAQILSAYQGRNKMHGRQFVDDVFELILLYANWFRCKFLFKLVPKRSVISKPAIWSRLDQCLAPSRRHAIIWTNVGLGYWRMCASLGLSAFNSVVISVDTIFAYAVHPTTWWRHQMETFPRYWPFVRGIQRWPVNSPHKGQWRGALMFFFDLRLNKRLSKQSQGWWCETPSCSLWRRCNEICGSRFVVLSYS